MAAALGMEWPRPCLEAAEKALSYENSYFVDSSPKELDDFALKRR